MDDKQDNRRSYAESVRERAVREVDQRHGYTMEFSSSPEAHDAEYDERERELMSETRRSDVEVAQWLDKIRSSYEMAVRRDDYAIPRSVVGDLLDHIDALTAERDALRAGIQSILDDAYPHPLTRHTWLTDRLAALLNNSPSPVEGSQP